MKATSWSLEYSGGDRLYLPLYAIEKIKKYHAEEGVLPKTDRLGGKTWQRAKERVRKENKGDGRETTEALCREGGLERFCIQRRHRTSQRI